MKDEPDGRDGIKWLYWRAEILQALYWLRGEGIDSEVEPAVLARFLAAEPAEIAVQMERLAADGFLEAAGGTRYRLTTQGVAEGGRSFQDEFAALTRPAHGECAPGCTCLDPAHAHEPCPSHPGGSDAR